MASIVIKRPEVAKRLKELVESYGKEEPSWAHIARQLDQEFGYKVPLPTYIKRTWEALTTPRSNVYHNEAVLIVNTLLDAKCNYIEGKRMYEQHMGQKCLSQRYKERLSVAVRRVIKEICKVIGTRKSFHCQKLVKFSYKSIVMILRAGFIGRAETVEEKDVVKYSILFQNLFRCWASSKSFKDNFKEKDKTDAYVAIKDICTRRQFEYAMQQMYYIHELKQINIGKYKKDEDCQSHPFMQRTIKENEKSGVYKKYVNKRDWEDMYEKYVEHKLDEEPKKYLFLHQKRKAKGDKEFVMEEKQMMTNISKPYQQIQVVNDYRDKISGIKTSKRGKIYLPSQPVIKNQTLGESRNQSAMLANNQKNNAPIEIPDLPEPAISNLPVLEDMEDESNYVSDKDEAKRAKLMKRREQMQQLYEAVFMNNSDSEEDY